MINIYNQNWIPFGWIGITIFPFIFYYHPEDEVSSRLRKHEEYHWWHQLRWLVIPWFIAYGALHLIYGYRDNPWEKLAREAENVNN